MTLREDANQIMQAALKAALPDTAVQKALAGAKFGPGRLVLVAAGKAAWQMAKTACDVLGDRISDGVVITKYDHAKGDLPRVKVFEAGHPVPDGNSFSATEKAIAAVEDLTADDTVLFLLSGGGSALFEKPLISGSDLESLTKQMLASGADIVEINTVRKRLSAVKGGRFAQICSPAKVFSVVLSDIIGDPLDMIASGPAYPDASTCERAVEIVKKYNLRVTPEIEALLQKETPKSLDNVETQITGSVRQLCKAAEAECIKLGYTPITLTASLCCTACDVGSFLASIAKDHQDTDKPLAYIAGGETVVQLTGKGKGGRNQEIALAAAAGIYGLRETAVFSIGSDGTDGPTDAAGGYCDDKTKLCLAEQGVDIAAVLADNDAYHALEKCGGLIKTGATGTNVNDLTVLLIKR
ncbi:MAG: glycerate kinase [Synergistaceae bacterium]|nr:glycerate kinase [Synergistaceae bacterium]